MSIDNVHVRGDLYRLYVEIQEKVNKLEEIMMRDVGGHEYNVARAYWLASLKVGLSSADYCTNNATFQTFLEGVGIIDENDDFIEDNEVEDDEDDEDDED